MGQLIDGKRIARELRSSLKKRVTALTARGSTPALAVVLVGEDKPSATYVRKKREAAERIGVRFELRHLDKNSTNHDVLLTIQELQSDTALSGIIVQLPLPDHLDTQAILEAIDPKKDVDCLTRASEQELERGELSRIPPTPGAVLSILGDLGVDPKGKRAAVFGRGPLVGKPLAVILRHLGAHVDVIHSKTNNAEEISRTADIIVSGVGKKHLVTKDMVKPGAIVIDAGASFEDDLMFGDVDVEEVQNIAAWITPTPGGVGPITVARLLQNVVDAAEQEHP